MIGREDYRRHIREFPTVILVLILIATRRVSASAALSTDAYVDDTDRFPGWKGEQSHVTKLDASFIIV